MELVVVGEVVRGGPIVRSQAHVQASERRHLHGRGACGATGKHGDGATIDRARSERAADRQRDTVGPVLAAEQQHVDHLPGGVRASVTVGQPSPQLIEAVRPPATIALLRQGDGVLQSAGLSSQQIEIVIELGAGAELAVQPLMPGDLPAACG